MTDRADILEHLTAELAENLVTAIHAFAATRAVLASAERRDSAEAERALLRLAIRHGLDLGESPPLTRERLGLWRCWIGHGIWRGHAELKPGPRWRRVRSVFGALTWAALAEVRAVDGLENSEAELRLAERVAWADAP